jgi:hypothetical protein
MTEEPKIARIKLRFNAAVERTKPGFQVSKSKFEWYAVLNGRCGFTLEEHEYTPPGIPPLLTGSDLTYEFKPRDMVWFGISLLLARSRGDLLKEYFAALDLKLNQHRKANILLVEDLYSHERSLSPRYPSLAEWGLTGKFLNDRNIFHALLRFDRSGDAYITLKLKRKYFVSWLQTIERSLEKKQEPEIIIHFEKSLHRSAEDEHDVNWRMHQFLEGLLDGKDFLLSSSFSMRGFVFSFLNHTDD